MKYKLERLRRRVRVKHNVDGWSHALTEDEAVEITNLVTQRELGTRIAYDIWRMKDNACVTLFILHWGNQ